MKKWTFFPFLGSNVHLSSVVLACDEVDNGSNNKNK